MGGVLGEWAGVEVEVEVEVWHGSGSESLVSVHNPGLWASFSSCSLQTFFYFGHHRSSLDGYEYFIGLIS